jgi:HEAT repeat protein
MAIGSLGPAAAALLPDLIQDLNDSDSRRKLQIVRAIASMRGAAVPALPELIKVASAANIDPTMRLALADAFQNMGEKASSAVPILVQMLKDKNLIVQQKAVIALGAMGPAAKDAVKPLQELAGVQARLRVSIFMSLSRINPQGSATSTAGSVSR